MAAEPLTIGRWTLHERIGAGRLAHVHRATGAAGEAAIKLLAPGADADDPAAVARFRREIAALATVQHPAVLPLLDHGVDPELGPFLVTPLVRGRTLRRLIGDGPAEPALAALLGREVAGALAAIHAAGLVHRDLKPENVMIGDDGAVVVIDLGLAWSPHHTRYTDEGSVAGSVPYMAPEQIEGGEPSSATDAWALGVILHEWITGARPFARGQPGEEVAAILAAAPPPLDDVDPRVPPELAALVADCLRRDPAARPADLHGRLAALAPGDAAAALRDPAAFNAAEADRQIAVLGAEARRLLAAGRPFAAAPLIERALRHRPGDPTITALADEVGRAPAPRPLRWPWLVAGAVAIAAVSATIAVLVTRRGDASAPGIDAGPPPLTADELPEQVPVDPSAVEEALYTRSEPFLPLDPRLGAVHDGLFDSHQDVAEATATPASADTYLRGVFSSSTRGAEGEKLLADVLARYPDHAPLWVLRAEVSARLGRREDADAALERALSLEPGLAAAWAVRARLHRLDGRLRAAFEAVDAGRRAAPDDPDLLMALVDLYRAAGRGADARPFAERAAELVPDDADAWVALASVSETDQAYDFLARAARLDPENGEAWKRLCLLGLELERAEARHDCQQAKRKGDYADPDLALAESARAERAGDLEEARAAIWANRYADNDLRLVLRLLELNEKLGSDYEVERMRAKACALGHQPSCADRAGSADGGL